MSSVSNLRMNTSTDRAPSRSCVHLRRAGAWHLAVPSIGLPSHCPFAVQLAGHTLRGGLAARCAATVRYAAAPRVRDHAHGVWLQADGAGVRARETGSLCVFSCFPL